MIHHDLSKSFEGSLIDCSVSGLLHLTGFYQETGRAGRDGLVRLFLAHCDFLIVKTASKMCFILLFVCYIFLKAPLSLVHTAREDAVKAQKLVRLSNGKRDGGASSTGQANQFSKQATDSLAAVRATLVVRFSDYLILL